MQFDTTINPLQFNIAVSEDDGHLEFVVVSGTLLPLGGGQAMPLPIGLYRIPFPTKKAVQDFYNELGKAVEEMPDDPQKSDIVVAQDLNQVNNVAQQISKFK